MRRFFETFGIWLLAIFVFFVPATDSAGGERKIVRPEFRIAVVPEKNAYEQHKRYRPIVKYISHKLGLRADLQILHSYGAICDAFEQGVVDAGFFGSFSYAITHSKVGVELIARPVSTLGSDSYVGYIIARKDSGIKKVEDMRGKTLVLVDRATTAGYLFPQAYLAGHGVNNLQGHFADVKYAGSHDAAAWSVYIKEANVGGCKGDAFDTLAIRYSDFKKNMVVLAKSEKVPSNGMAVRKDLDHGLKLKLKQLLLELDKSEDGREVLSAFGSSKFIEVADADYAPVYKMARQLGLDLRTY